MVRASAPGGLRPDAAPAEVIILLGGGARARAAAGERDPAVWRRCASLVVDALRA
jgi:hypothetical protein